MKRSTQESCVLVCEDEMIIAMMIEDLLLGIGYRVLMAGQLERALELAESAAIDAALLDINLGGEYSFPVALKLRDRGIAFAFTSGYGGRDLPRQWYGTPLLQKPYDTNQVAAAVSDLLQR